MAIVDHQALGDRFAAAIDTLDQQAIMSIVTDDLATER